VSDPKKDEITKLVEQTIEGLIEEALVVGDTGYMEFDPAGARGVITKALASQTTGVCDECGLPLVPSEATWYHRDCDLKRDEARAEELRSLREERDALKAQISGVGIVPYLDRMKELAEARDEALALMKRDQPDMYRALLADQAKQDELRSRAESAEAELLRAKQQMASDETSILNLGAALEERTRQRGVFEAEARHLDAELSRLREGLLALDRYIADGLEGELLRVADVEAFLAPVQEKVT
jgi:hypothetical protein